MSELYSNYEQTFCKHLNSLQKKIDNMKNQSKEHKETAITEAQYEIQQAEQCLKQMNMELMTLPEQSKYEVNSSYRRHKSDLEDLKRQFRRLEDNYIRQKSRDTLMGSRLDDPTQLSTDHKQSLLSVNEKHMQQNYNLEMARRTGETTKEVANGIEVELQRQRETLTRATENVRRVDHDVSKSNRLIDRMRRNALKNKVILCCVVVFLFIALGVIVYWRLGGSGEDVNDNQPQPADNNNENVAAETHRGRKLDFFLG
eukprot:CAMPEP_0115015028 /NCGR_PEP_ID=MMETSP0216-20121206/26490_1 /TAXON_ID=223996 /ORGANISM="Protocruzia adherens, Strain Boccale" /LENGTH=256 /DNA_ID=CAMNT_0002385001 /DNA_START=78 /DNA_END=848 /DNA_ORIENTATION=-